MYRHVSPGLVFVCLMHTSATHFGTNEKTRQKIGTFIARKSYLLFFLVLHVLYLSRNVKSENAIPQNQNLFQFTQK